MEPRGPAEARLLHVERALEAMGRDIRTIRTKAINVAQEVWDTWGAGGASTGAATCAATYSGTLLDCTSTGIVGQTITVKNLLGGVLGTCVSGAAGAFSGSVTIMSPTQAVTLNTAAFTGYAASSLMTSLSCGSNSVGTFSPTPIVTVAPTLNGISNQTNKCATGGSYNIALSGITDGNSNTALPITITATSSNTGVVPNPSITYTSPNTTGTLTYTPVMNVGGTATISVKVLNSGPTTCGSVNSLVRTFTVGTIDPRITPTVTQNANYGPVAHGFPYIIFFGGTGPSGVGPLTITITSSNHAVALDPPFNYSGPGVGANGSMTVSPIAAGVTTITVSVISACGGTATDSFTFTAT
jgi:hypothetical protein